MYMSSIQKRVSCDRPSGVGSTHCRSAKREPVVEILLVLGLDVDFQGHGAEDGVVDVIALGDQRAFRAAGHQGIEFLDQPVAQIGVVRELGEVERAIPGADFAVEDGARVVLVRAGDEVLGQRLTHLLRRAPRGPVAEVILLRGEREGHGRQKQSQYCKFQNGFHANSSNLDGGLRLKNRA